MTIPSRPSSRPESALNAAWIPLKLHLAHLKESLSEREWGTLRAILAIYLEADAMRDERERAGVA